MCTPIVIDSPNVDLSKAADGTTPAATPAGTGNPAPSATTNTPQMDTPALAADEGRVFVPGAVYPDAAGTGLPAGTAGTVVSDNTNAPQLDPANKPRAAGTPLDGPTADLPPGATPAAGGSGDPITDQNTLLINSLTTLAHQFSDTTAGILQGQKDASNALTSGFLNLSQQQQKALDAADALRKNTGQAARKPSYSLSMAKVQRANAGGPSSTMLTGVAGVPTNQLALGRAQLLGGAPA